MRSMIVLGCDRLSSSLEVLKEDHDIKSVTILSNEALILCRERDSVDGTCTKLISVKYNSAEYGDTEIQESEYFRGKNITDIFSRGTHAIVIETDGKVHGWGCHSRGLISTLQDDGKGTSSFVPIPKCLFWKSVVVQVACGNTHTIILLNIGDVCAMGNNEYGQLGIDCKGNASRPTKLGIDCKGNASRPTLISCMRGLPVSQIAAGGWHSFCVTISGRVFSWGRNDFGQLGLGNMEKKLLPSIMGDFVGKSVAFIAAGEHHNAMLTRGGELFTFGKGLHGQLGHGDTQNEPTPRRVSELEGSVVTQVACGENHTVAYVPDCDKIFVFGLNNNGQLGTTKDVAITEPQMLHDEIQTDTFHKISAHGNMTFFLDLSRASSGPSDYRVIDEQRRVITIEGICQTADNSNTEDSNSEFLSAPASFLNCWNASFFLANGLCSIEDPVIDFDAVLRAAGILTKNLTEGEFFAFVNSSERLLQTLGNNEDIETLRFYIIFPALMENIRKMTSNGSLPRAEITKRIIRMFLEKLMGLEHGTQRLAKWYRSLNPDSFPVILGFYKHCLEESLKRASGLLRVIEVPFRTLLLNHLKILNDINNKEQLVRFEEFYLNDVTGEAFYQEFIDWREKRKSRPILLLNDITLLFECPFLLNGKAKCLVLEFNTRQRLNINRKMIIPPNILMISREKDIITEVIRELNMTKDLQKPLRVQFLGEPGIDDGALSKELFMLVFDELLKNQYGLFVEDENSKILWFDRKSSPENNKLYNSIGKLCGLSVYNSIIVNLNFPLALYKKLLGVKTSLSDLKELDPLFGSSLQQMLSFVEDDGITMEDVFGSFSFTTTDGVPLKEGGDEIPVTVANREEYVELYVKYMLDVSVQPQFEAFSSGFLAVFAGDDILHEIFTPEELMSMVSGTQDYDWNELKKNTVYQMFMPEEQTIVWFWEVMLSMSSEEKQEFLVYLTGSNKIPISGLKMKIVRVHECDQFLPPASVCYNTLYLHPYSTKDILENRLKRAIKCKGFYLK